MFLALHAARYLKLPVSVRSSRRAKLHLRLAVSTRFAWPTVVFSLLLAMNELTVEGEPSLTAYSSNTHLHDGHLLGTDNRIDSTLGI